MNCLIKTSSCNSYNTPGILLLPNTMLFGLSTCTFMVVYHLTHFGLWIVHGYGRCHWRTDTLFKICSWQNECWTKLKYIWIYELFKWHHRTCNISLCVGVIRCLSLGTTKHLHNNVSKTQEYHLSSCLISTYFSPDKVQVYSSLWFVQE